MGRRRDIFIILVASAFVLALTHFYTVFFASSSGMGRAVTVEITKGMSFRVIAQRLKDGGVIKDVDNFMLAARLTGAYKKVQAGEYELSSRMAPLEVLEILKKGKVKTYRVTVPEGYNIREIAGLIEKAGLAEAEEFLARAQSKGFAGSLGFEGSTLEGYLFPDTYVFKKGMKADEILVRMTDRFRAVYAAEFEAEARKRGFSMKRLVTLASIIEKETGVPEERPLISAVFHNRLRKGIPLQSDPTVIYSIKDFDGNLTKKHLSMKSPYNTYKNYGLPPGPISNPGREALRAALNPVPVSYLYFVSKNDGTHHFSTNLREHTDAVNRYQRGRNSKG